MFGNGVTAAGDDAAVHGRTGRGVARPVRHADRRPAEALIDTCMRAALTGGPRAPNIEIGGLTSNSKRLSGVHVIRPHIVLLGMMGAGKTTVGDLLAARIDRPFRDSDRDIERIAGRTGREIAANEGVDELHRLEEEVLLDALESTQPSIVSAAGWVIESPRCRAAIRNTAVAVWLRLSPEDLRTRMDQGAHRRDLPDGELARLLERREPLLLEIADIVIDAAGTPTDIVRELVSEITHAAEPL